MFDAADYVVVYYERLPGHRTAWWTRSLAAQFAHVEVWWHLGDEYWVAVRPNHSHMTCDVMTAPPRVGEHGVSALQVVHCKRASTRPMCPFGLKTCVAVVKAVLGVRAAWIVTPRQLFVHVEGKRRVIR